jgi:hypothetical protein
MDFNLQRIFTTLAIVAAIVGWVVIEGAIWIGSHIIGILA